ncbi:MAG: sensor histidine kinase [Hymenobacter sp.]|nr:MAG: sensor histidine kinase [Hymenobacter sp.]
MPISAEQLRLFVLASFDMVYWMSADWQQMHLLVGKDQLQDTLQPTQDWLRTYIPAAAHNPVQAAITQAVTTKSLFELEHQVHLADGTLGWVQSRAVPLLGPQGDLLGWVGAASDITARRAAEQENLRLRLAQQQALFEAMQTAQEAERRRFSEALHDGLGQLLYATQLQLGQVPPGPAQQQAMHLLKEAVHQARTLSHELTPALLEEFGLGAALQNICRDLSTPTMRWRCVIVLDEALPVSLPLQLAVYRLAQGLAHNVAKHAQATEAVLEAERLPRWLVLRVEDNGRGFDPAAATQGIGLRTIRNRVSLLGGTVRLVSTPGQGTECQIRLPVPAT